MSQVVNTNMASINSQGSLNKSQASQMQAMQRLSSGLRINSAKDDAAGLAISERMSAQIRGLNQASRNVNDGISLAQTAEGDLGQVTNSLQRMRELAVQAINATNTDSDRAALNQEMQQLIEEVDRVAQKSEFNGVKLLDGSFSAKNFQVGANSSAADTITINSIASARTSQLGSVGTSYEATTTSGATTAALSAGDITLNGFQVGASQLGTAPGQSTASASSIAAAINAISSDSGVTATANTNTVTGSAATAFTAITADTFSINGINVGAVALGSSAAGQGANVAAAINAVKTQTGVTAVADATTGALTLTASDGRDIKVSLNVASGATSAATQKATFLTQTGLATGDVGIAGTTTVTSGAITAAALTTASTTDSTATVTVDGITLATGTAQATGTLISAAQLDTAWTTFAAANTGYTLTGTFAAGDAQITKADGTAVTIASTFVAGTGGAGTALSTATAGFIGTTAAGTGDTTNHGTITLSSNSADGIVWGGAAATNAGLATTGTTTASTTSTVSSIASSDLLTAANATKALAAIDGALSTVNSSRASLGAIQNRFTSAVSSLQISAENVTSARSRIQDADFAMETAELSRSQILQQAGTAMVAQANQAPQGVLALLR